MITLTSPQRGAFTTLDQVRVEGTVTDPSGLAYFMINGEPAGESTPLSNGDEIELGAAKLQFWLGGVRQKNLAAREAAGWALLGAITVAEVILLLWLT